MGNTNEQQGNKALVGRVIDIEECNIWTKKPYKFTDEVKDEFIKNYINTFGNVHHACKRTLVKCYKKDTFQPISRMTIDREKKKNPKFVKKLEEADKIIDDNVKALIVKYDILDPAKFNARKWWLERNEKKTEGDKIINVYGDLTVNQIQEKIDKEINRIEVLRDTINGGEEKQEAGTE